MQPHSARASAAVHSSWDLKPTAHFVGERSGYARSLLFIRMKASRACLRDEAPLVPTCIRISPERNPPSRRMSFSLRGSYKLRNREEDSPRAYHWIAQWRPNQPAGLSFPAPSPDDTRFFHSRKKSAKTMIFSRLGACGLRRC